MQMEKVWCTKTATKYHDKDRASGLEGPCVVCVYVHVCAYTCACRLVFGMSRHLACFGIWDGG